MKSGSWGHLLRVVVRVTLLIFFFQAEDGIRDGTVTGVQTCLFRSTNHPCQRHKPISPGRGGLLRRGGAVALGGQGSGWQGGGLSGESWVPAAPPTRPDLWRSEERRVGKECRCRWRACQERRNGRQG